MVRRPDPRVDPDSDPPERGVVDSGRTAPPAERSAPDPERGARSVTSLDPRLEAVEPLVARGDWANVSKQLGPMDKAGFLPPNLGLLFALAHHESASEEDAGAGNEIAIRCMAGLLGVASESPVALVLAKRLLRKNPQTWREKPAPPARVSFLIVLAVLVLGAAVGWFGSSGTVRELVQLFRR